MHVLNPVWLWISFFSLWLLLPAVSLAEKEEAPPSQTLSSERVTEITDLFKQKSFKKKGSAVDLLVNSGHAQAEQLLKPLLKGRLYYHREHDTLAIVSGGLIKNALTLKKIPDVTKKDFKKITVNNKLRKQIRTGLAQLRLTSSDDSTREKAVNELLNSITPETAVILHRLIPNETNPDIRETMQLGITIADLKHEQADKRLAAIDAVSENLHPTVRNRLTALTDDTDPAIAKAAQQALKTIEGKIEMYGYAETLFFGLSLGSVLVLAAIGLAITFGVMGVINMAHGELIMLGAYTTYIVQQLMPNFIDYSLFVAIPAAFIVSGFVGILIERGVIRHLYGRPLETLLATFGISLILQQLVRTVISPQNVPVANPAWMSGTLDINSVLSLTYNRLYILLFCLLVFAVLLLILRKTNLGLQVRAVSQNRAMARAMGVRSSRVDALTFGLGSGIAGVAGVALSQLTNVGPNLGQAYIVDSFMVVVFGGVGNLWGTLVAGLSLGILNKFMEPWTGAVLAKILVLIFIILFIQKRPRGLFPQKGRAAGD